MTARTQTAIITGAGSGIGLAIAEAFIRDGANVVLNGRTESKLARAAQSLGAPDRVAIVPGDVTRSDTPDRLIAAATERFDRVDVLVNNAGTFESKPFTDYAIEELDAFLGYLRATRPGSSLEGARRDLLHDYRRHTEAIRAAYLEILGATDEPAPEQA